MEFQTWQPMHTVPTDGRAVLVLGKTGYVDVLRVGECIDGKGSAWFVYDMKDIHCYFDDADFIGWFPVAVPQECPINRRIMESE